MTAPTPGAGGRPFTLVDCSACLAVLVGAVTGAIWGYNRYGVLGAVAGVPLGGVLGLLAVFVALVSVALAVVGVLAAGALLAGGPKGLADFLRNGPRGLRKGNPPPPPEGSNQSGE